MANAAPLWEPRLQTSLHGMRTWRTSQRRERWTATSRSASGGLRPGAAGSKVPRGCRWLWRILAYATRTQLSFHLCEPSSLPACLRSAARELWSRACTRAAPLRFPFSACAQPTEMRWSAWTSRRIGVPSSPRHHAQSFWRPTISRAPTYAPCQQERISNAAQPLPASTRPSSSTHGAVRLERESRAKLLPVKGWTSSFAASIPDRTAKSSGRASYVARVRSP